MEILQLTDAQTGSTVRIAAHLGFNCFEFQARMANGIVDVLWSMPDFESGGSRPSRSGIPILFPFPNRIRHGRFAWQGRHFELPTWHGHAIHGFCLDRAWRVIQDGSDFATGEFQLSVDAPDRLPLWPGDFRLRVRYELRNNVLRCDVHITNPGDTDLPWGFGTHPYFKVPLAVGSAPRHCLVQASTSRQWELDGVMPTGRVIPVQPGKDLREGEYFDQLFLDDVYTGLTPRGNVDECLVMDEKAGLEVVQRFDARAFRELVVFTHPNRTSICLEPYTCVTDAINLQPQGIDAGLQVLPPGAEFRTWIEIQPQPVLA